MSVTTRTTPVGSSPAWVAGYVPPAAEWNATFAGKLDVTDPVIANGPFMPTGGGEMLGKLLLLTDLPTQPQEAVSKAYVDSLTFAAGPFMPQSGGTFSGPVIHTSTLTLVGNPVGNLDAAPKQYVDATGTLANNALTVANAAVRRAGDLMTGLLTLSTDPVSPMHAATKQYADTKLAIAGGNVTGSVSITPDLTVGRNLYVTNTLYVGSFNGWEWNFTVGSNGDHYQSYRTGWADIWQSSTGTRLWIGNNNSLMTLDGSGNLWVSANVTSNTATHTTLNVGQNLSVGGTTTTTAFAMGPWMFYNNGNQVQQHSVGWFEQWDSTTGARTWYNNNVLKLTLNPSGDLSCAGTVTGGQIASAAGIFAVNQDMYTGAGGSGRVFQFAPSYYFDWNIGNGTLQYARAGSPFWVMNVTNSQCGNNLGPVYGLGAYIANSDERGKTDIAPAPVGLDEVLALKPIGFTRIHDGRSEIGFSAQQVQQVIPEAVRLTAMPLPDGSEESLGVATDPIIAALVVGMQQLAAELAALKAAR